MAFQSSTSRHGGTDPVEPCLGTRDEFRFNPLHRGMGVLTGGASRLSISVGVSFNPLHRGMGVLTERRNRGPQAGSQFQSSTSRHGGTDSKRAGMKGENDVSFNPLHRGMGVLTQGCEVTVTPLREFQSSTSRHGGTDPPPRPRRQPPRRVSILYIEAWGY